MSASCSRRSWTMAEKEGKTVDLLVVPSVDPFDAIVQTAAKLQVSRVVTGVSLRWIRRNWRGASVWRGRVCRSPGIRFRSRFCRRTAVVLRQPGTPPAAAVAGRSGAAARSLAGSAEGVRLQAASSRCRRRGAAASGARSRRRRAQRAGVGGSGFRSSPPLGWETPADWRGVSSPTRDPAESIFQARRQAPQGSTAPAPWRPYPHIPSAVPGLR